MLSTPVEVLPVQDDLDCPPAANDDVAYHIPIADYLNQPLEIDLDPNAKRLLQMIYSTYYPGIIPYSNLLMFTIKHMRCAMGKAKGLITKLQSKGHLLELASLHGNEESILYINPDLHPLIQEV